MITVRVFISNYILISGFVALSYIQKLRDRDVLSYWKLLVDLVLDTVNWVYFSVEEQKVLRFVKHRADIKPNPVLFGYSVVVGIELRFAEAS